jgi:hypothetical protein
LLDFFLFLCSVLWIIICHFVLFHFTIVLRVPLFHLHLLGTPLLFSTFLSTNQKPKNNTTNSHRPQYLELIHVYLFGNLRISININIYIKHKI